MVGRTGVDDGARIERGRLGIEDNDRMGGSGQEREGRHGLLGGVEARPDDVLDRRLRRVGVGLPESHLHGPGVVLFLFLLPLGQLARRVREEVEQGQCFPGRGGVARVEQAGDSLGDDLTDSYIGLTQRVRVGWGKQGGNRKVLAWGWAARRKASRELP